LRDDDDDFQAGGGGGSGGVAVCITKTANDKLARHRTYIYVHMYKRESSLSGKYVKLSDTISTALWMGHER